MTSNDFEMLLALISSDRLSIKGNEVQCVAQLQIKLAQLIRALAAPKPKPPDKGKPAD